MSRETTPSLESVYSRLRSRFGFLNWWPGETKDEIIIGAILTQNTSWRNVEKAIGNLKRKEMLELRKISSADTRSIEELIKPSGFYRQKARRLIGFARYVFSNYKGIDEMFNKSTEELRKELLSLNGIGMETADSIILYSAEKPVFVIDAYTRRILGRVYGRKGKELGYEELQRFITKGIRNDTELYKDLHAQFVELAKNHCRKEPICQDCPINSVCSYYKSVAQR